ncbi:glycosyltransferase [Novosphingobium lentum]|uniref:glycosyltransferase n=1 Tax=Novosphingobium lentum TaxID=145287 RepID=UPI00082E4032|nr:glycosyltransferase [Novosphingobium lentum]
MRILHVAESIKGGCGTYLNQIVRCQLVDPAIAAVRTILPEAHAGQVPDIPASDRVLLDHPGGRSVRSIAALRRTIAEQIRGFEPDCVHLHSTFAGLAGRLCARPALGPVPIVYCAHGWAFDMERSALRNRAIALAERLLSRRCDRVVAISDYERRRGIAIGIAPDRIVTVLNGMADIAPPPPPVPGPIRRVLFIGRLDRQKGIDVLFAAVDGLADRIALRVIGTTVVGDQPIDPAPADGVTMLGWCDEDRIRSELAWCDVVVVPSRWEGFGLVAVEAMRSGRAVIASDVGGLPEVVDRGATGLLVPVEDPQALRHALLSASDAQIVAMGQAGRQRFLDRFTIDRTVDGLSRVYAQSIANRT